MILTEQYQKIVDKVHECQQYDKPVVMLWVETEIDDDGDIIDRTHRLSACNSSAEALGIVMRGHSMMNTIQVFDIGLNDTEEK